MTSTLAWRRDIANVGEVWVRLNPLNNRYQWRCPSRPHFCDWSPSHFGTYEDAFKSAADTVHRYPFLEASAAI